MRRVCGHQGIGRDWLAGWREITGLAGRTTGSLVTEGTADHAVIG